MREILILTPIKQKCRECNCNSCLGKPHWHCKKGINCKGTGQQEIEIYVLRDFEKCECGGIHLRINHQRFPHPKCNGTGYIIPKEYEPYEIKTAQELDNQFKNDLTEKQQLEWEKLVHKHNLKEDD